MISEIFDGMIEIETIKKSNEDTLEINKKIGVLRMKSVQPDALYHNLEIDHERLYIL